MRKFVPFVFFLVIMICHAGYAKAQKSSTITNSGNEVILSDSLQQQMRYGVFPVSWFWFPSLSEGLADLAVKDVDTDYLRVSIHPGYELTEGEENPDAYTKILNMMNAMKKANPDIKFAAMTAALQVAYEDNDAVPWTPYPMWVFEHENVGTEEDPQWEQREFHVDKLVQYFADYLNFMDQEGFEITWLELTNEHGVLRPRHTKTIHDSLPKYLNEGVHMPELIVPSAWSHQSGIDWLKNVDTTKNEHQAFSVAATHNTFGNMRSEAFADEARKLGDKEV